MTIEYGDTQHEIVDDLERRYRDLRAQAKEETHENGHQMRVFETTGSSDYIRSRSTCEVCQMAVEIDTRHGISGQAVAFHCLAVDR